MEVVKRTFVPEKAEWIHAVKKALAKKMEKIVLARCQILELESCPDPFALTAALQRKAQGAHVFCFSEGDISFFGASPERLFSANGRIFIAKQWLEPALAEALPKKTRGWDKSS